MPARAATTAQVAAQPAAPPEAAVAPAAVRTSSASSLQPLQLGAIAGAALAAIGTLLSWVPYGESLVDPDSNGWHSGFAMGDFTKARISIDAIVIVALSGLAVYIFLGHVLRMRVPNFPFAGVILAGLIAAVGAWNYLYLKDIFSGEDDFSVGLGVYAVIAGGAIAAVCAFLEQQQRARV